MAGFEMQGQTAASCEPLKQWCEKNGVDCHVSSAENTSQHDYRNTWNELLVATEEGDMDSSTQLIETLDETVWPQTSN